MIVQIALFKNAFTDMGPIPQKYRDNSLEARVELIKYLQKHSLPVYHPIEAEWMIDNREFLFKRPLSIIREEFPSETVYFYKEKSSKKISQIIIGNADTSKIWLISTDKGKEYIQYFKIAENGYVSVGSEKNTQLEYSYRDAEGRETHKRVILDGVLSKKQIEQIYESIVVREFFIPGKVQLPCFDYIINIEKDFPWFRIDKDAFTVTDKSATLQLTANQAYHNFLSMKNKWLD